MEATSSLTANNSTLAKKDSTTRSKRNELVQMISYLENGTCIGNTQIQQHVSTRSEQELCSMHGGGASALSKGGKSDGNRG